MVFGKKNHVSMNRRSKTRFINSQNFPKAWETLSGGSGKSFRGLRENLPELREKSSGV